MRTFQFHILSKFEVLDDTGEAKPTEGMFTIEEFIWIKHLLETSRTISFVFLDFNIHNLLLDLIEGVDVSHDFNFSETEFDFIS